ncbi:hypothetical protein QOT17_002828 [Balamuthia mandrillaris]
MSATANNVCGSCLGWTALILLFLSLVIPWYLATAKIESIYAEDCSTALFFFWAHTVCSSSAACENGCGNKVIAFWGEKDNHFGTVFAPTFFLMLFATIIALSAALVFSARCCCMNGSSSRTALLTKAALILAVLGVLVLTVAIILFAAALPNAWKANVNDETQTLKGPWDSFIGHNKAELASGLLETSAWAPVGWWFALVGWPFMVGTTIALAVAFRSGHREAGYSIINH